MQQHKLGYPPESTDLSRAMDVVNGLADQTRLQIVLLLSMGEESVGELVNALSLPQSTVSRHLSRLRTARLVATRRDGTVVYYRLGNAHLGHIVLETLSFAEHERLALPDH